jgi:hypothetical protein
MLSSIMETSIARVLAAVPTKDGVYRLNPSKIMGYQREQPDEKADKTTRKEDVVKMIQNTFYSASRVVTDNEG